MTAKARPVKSLRRRLFGSHLLVMAVALAVLIVVFALLRLGFDWRTSDGRPNGVSRLIPVLVAPATAALASAIVSWHVAKRLAKPMHEIGDATRQLAAGRYQVRLPGADTFELNALATDVNRLAEELETTEQRRLRPIGDVSHELRNPLSTIEGTMEALLDGVVQASDDTYARVGREAARLSRLADDLSSLSVAGELAIVDRGIVDLALAARDVVDQLEPQAAAKNLSLKLESSMAHEVSGDRDRLAQVLMNVIGNAVQYTTEGGVVVRLAREDGVVLIEVKDTGRGLALEDQARIVDRFHRVDRDFADGTGVGLAIAKLIVEAHDGSVAATSPGLELGTTVRIELPAAG